MDLLDFFMPEPAQAMHLRSIADSMRLQATGSHRAARKADRTEHEVGALALVCMALVASLIEKGVITELDLQMHLNAIDSLDSVQDGRLDPVLLRSKLGLKSPTPTSASPAKRTTPRPRRKRPA
jgi:hypothetical protein